MHLTICIITYRRPEGLRRLLRGINKLVFIKCPPPVIKVVVIDNDENRLTCNTGAELAEKIKWSLDYHIEPRRGIPYARNTAVKFAGDTDFIVFIDDDEVPQPAWLDELLYVQVKCNADVVTGPVLPYFPDPTPKWIEKGKFFERARHPDEMVIQYARTSNVLIKRETIDKYDLTFDENMALTGGSDAIFFLHLIKKGGKIVWADNAIVHERIPESRAKAGWILQRAYRVGNTELLSDIIYTSPIKAKVLRLMHGSIRVIGGAIMLPVMLALAPAVGKHNLIRILKIIYRGAGMVMSVFGKRYEEYRIIHGS